ncbi:MAG: hypothetical protein AAB729_03305, partial [Patescibacteria group bacterium]
QPIQKPMEEVRKNPNFQFPISNDDSWDKRQNPNFQLPHQQSPEAQALGGQAISNEGAGGKGPISNANTENLAKPVNIAEVTKPKLLSEDLVQPGLKMWNSNPPQMGQRISNSGGMEAIKTTSPQPSPQKERGKIPAVDIDKKLEDLEKRITPVK